MNKLILIFLILFSIDCFCQNKVIVDGELEITEVNESNSENHVLTINNQGEVNKSSIDSLVSNTLSNADLLVTLLLDLGINPMRLYEDGVSTSNIIGKKYGGGFIFYLDTLDIYPNFEGLIVNSNNIGLAKWGCTGTNISGSNDNNLGGGETNTESILNLCNEENIGASLCNDHVSEGFNDWYLPSESELRLAHDVTYGNGVSWLSGGHWTSINVNSNDALTLNIFSFGFIGNALTVSKNLVLYIRPVRKF